MTKREEALFRSPIDGLNWARPNRGVDQVLRLREDDRERVGAWKEKRRMIGRWHKRL